jgi:methylmalonyl-CoA mutase N-terminal domain/subunit
MSAYDCTQSDPHAGRERWQQRYAEAEATGRVRDADFTTLSGGP